MSKQTVKPRQQRTVENTFIHSVTAVTSSGHSTQQKPTSNLCAVVNTSVYTIGFVWSFVVAVTPDFASNKRVNPKLRK